MSFCSQTGTIAVNVNRKNKTMVVANQMTIVAKQGKESELKSLLNTVVQQSIDEKGCLKYEFYQFEEERHHFIIIEIWKSQKAWQNHEKSAAYLAFLSEAADSIDSRSIRALKLTQCRSKLGFGEK